MFMEEIIQRKIEEKPTETKAIKTYIFALGGLNEVGKNICLYK